MAKLGSAMDTDCMSPDALGFTPLGTISSFNKNDMTCLDMPVGWGQSPWCWLQLLQGCPAQVTPCVGSPSLLLPSSGTLAACPKPRLISLSLLPLPVWVLPLLQALPLSLPLASLLSSPFILPLQKVNCAVALRKIKSVSVQTRE